MLRLLHMSARTNAEILGARVIFSRRALMLMREEAWVRIDLASDEQFFWMQHDAYEVLRAAQDELDEFPSSVGLYL